MFTKIKKCMLLALSLGVLGGSLSGLHALGLSDAIKLGLANSASLAKIQATLEKAKLSLDGSASLWGTALSANVSVPDGTLTSTLSVPVIPQLSIGARLSAGLSTDATASGSASGGSGTSQTSASANLSVKPFADTSQNSSKQLAYDLARLDYTKALTDAEIDIATSYAAAIKARSDRDIARKELEKAQADVAWKEKLAAAGGLRSQELSSARLSLSDAYKSVTSAERADLKARFDLSALIGTDISTLDAELSKIDGASESLTEILDPEASTDLAKVLAANTAVAKAQRNLESEEAFTFPSILTKSNLTAELSVPFQLSSSGELDWELSVGLQLTADSFSGIDEATASINLTAAKRDLQTALSTAAQDREIAILEYKLAVQLLNSGKEQKDAAATNLSEAQLRATAGDISELELQDYELAYQQAQSALISAQYDVLIARMKIEALTKA